MTDTVKYDISNPVKAAVEVDQKQAGNGTDPNTFTTSYGVKLRLKAVNRQSLGSISDKYLCEKPKPPIIMIESKGRKEPNHDDPDFQDALTSWNLSMSMAVSNFILLRGTELISVPDGMMSYDSDEWKFEMELMSDLADNPRACYLEWLRGVACSEDDSTKLFQIIGRKSNIAQEDVESAAAQFRS